LPGVSPLDLHQAVSLRGHHPPREQNEPSKEARVSTGYHNPDGDNPNPEVDFEAQRAARNAVMQIGQFPDFPVAMRRATGYGPWVDMMQHFHHWFHPRHKTMQDRWTMWKTYQQWWDECGLYERQVRKGVKRLKALGLIEVWYGPRKRPHYRVDWVRLAEVLSITSVNCGDGDEQDDGFTDSITSVNCGDAITSVNCGSQSRQLSGVSITEEDAVDNFTEESLLQSAPEPSSEEPGATKMDKEKEQKQVQEQPVEDKRISPNGHAPSTTTAGQEDGRATVVEITPPKPEDDALIDEIRAVLNPDNSGWCNAWWVRNNRPDYYTPKRIAYFLSIEEDLPRYEGRAEELEPYVAYVLWEESKEGAAA
jgi:hypothetical protein